MGKAILIDLHMLRIGTMLDTGVSNNKRWVKYIPFNDFGFRPKIINHIMPDALKPVPRQEELPGTSEQYYVLVSGEHGRSWFLEEWLGKKYPELMRRTMEMKEESRIAMAAVRAREREVTRGERAARDKLASDIRAFQSSKQIDDPKKRRLGGDLYGR